ncbi:MAG: hypothetical protein AAF990_05355 [Bacteroidota bacterium]
MTSPKTKQQIAHELGISLRTLQRWIKKAGLDVPRGLVCPQKQEEIMTALGYHVQKKEDNE